MTSPQKFGNLSGTVEVDLRTALLVAQGTAVATDEDSFAYARCHANAQAIAYLWHLNERLKHQFDATRMTDFLPRWERILGLRVLPGASDVDRRLAVKAKFELYGQPGTQQVVADLLTVIMGDVFVSLVHTSSTQAVGYCPGGAIVAGGVTLGDGDWYSTIAHLAIETAQPAGMSDGAYYTAVASLAAYLDDLLPVWVTHDWFLDGPHGAGFYLDEFRNLDGQRFN